MRLMRRHVLGLALAFAASASVAPALAAGTVNAAVAANFTQVATALAAKFKAKTGNDVKLSFGATGALYTQITQAAPFDVFLSADDKRTKTAIKDGFGVDGTDFTYAVGKVVLYSPAIDVTATRSADELSSSRGNPARIVWRNPFTLVSIISSSHSGFRSRKSP